MEGAGEVACCSFIFSAARVMLICTLELLFDDANAKLTECARQPVHVLGDVYKVCSVVCSVESCSQMLQAGRSI